MFPVLDIGIDLMPYDPLSPATALRVGTAGETDTFGVHGTLAAKEAATKVIGGRPARASLRDVALAATSTGDDTAAEVLLDILGDLGAAGPARAWRYVLADRARAAVGRAGGCTTGRGVLAELATGQLVAVCLGGEAAP
jgi:hypothetical protein